MRKSVLAALVPLAVSASAGAQRSELGWDTVDALEAAAASCPAAQLPAGVRAGARAMHVHDVEGVVLRQLALMLRSDSRACPGIAAEAAARLRAMVGIPERPDASSRVLALARVAAEEGLGMPRDPALADRYGRMEWLLSPDPPELPRWTAEQQQAWLARPETIALLEAVVAGDRNATRQPEMLAELRLRRDLPGYDPEAALALFERAIRYDRYAQLLTDGEHMPPDYRRAFEPMFRLGMFDLFDDQQRLVLGAGRRAAAAARTPEQRAQALRLLFAGSIDDLDGGCRFVAEQLRHFRAAPRVPLAPGDARRIHDRMANEYDALLVSDEPARPRPILLRGLIDPGGRLIFARVRQSSGSRDRDFFPVRAWATHAEEVDLSATSQGRFVWVDLPPIEPEPTTILEGGRLRSTCR